MDGLIFGIVTVSQTSLWFSDVFWTDVKSVTEHWKTEGWLDYWRCNSELDKLVI